MTNKEIIKNINSSNSSVVLDTLKYIAKEGNSDILKHVIHLLSTTSDTIIRDEIIKILEHLRDPDCTPIVINTIENSEYDDILAILIGSCWKNSLDFSDHIETFTDIFIKSEFQLAFDAFTVIDNLEEFNSRLADTCIFRLKNSVEDIKDDKKPLYFELINILNDKKENPA